MEVLFGEVSGKGKQQYSCCATCVLPHTRQKTSVEKNAESAYAAEESADEAFQKSDTKKVSTLRPVESLSADPDALPRYPLAQLARTGLIVATHAQHQTKPPPFLLRRLGNSLRLVFTTTVVIRHTHHPSVCYLAAWSALSSPLPHSHYCTLATHAHPT